MLHKNQEGAAKESMYHQRCCKSTGALHQQNCCPPTCTPGFPKERRQRMEQLLLEREEKIARTSTRFYDMFPHIQGVHVFLPNPYWWFHDDSLKIAGTNNGDFSCLLNKSIGFVKFFLCRVATNHSIWFSRKGPRILKTSATSGKV